MDVPFTRNRIKVHICVCLEYLHVTRTEKDLDSDTFLLQYVIIVIVARLDTAFSP